MSSIQDPTQRKNREECQVSLRKTGQRAQAIDTMVPMKTDMSETNSVVYTMSLLPEEFKTVVSILGHTATEDPSNSPNVKSILEDKQMCFSRLQNKSRDGEEATSKEAKCAL